MRVRRRDTRPVNRVSRFVLRDDDTVDPAAETVLIDNIPAPQSYHNGADLQFGKDGLLYVSTGDGGCDYAGDSGCLELNDAARDQHVLLGKILRITARRRDPAGNPWQGAGTARCNVTGRTTSGTRCQETFAWGLRNPFRIAFDPNSPSDPLLHQRRRRDHLGGDRPRARPARTTAGTCARGSARRARPPTAARRRPG